MVENLEFLKKPQKIPLDWWSSRDYITRYSQFYLGVNFHISDLIYHLAEHQSETKKFGADILIPFGNRLSRYIRLPHEQQGMEGIMKLQNFYSIIAAKMDDFLIGTRLYRRELHEFHEFVRIIDPKRKSILLFGPENFVKDRTLISITDYERS